VPTNRARCTPRRLLALTVPAVLLILSACTSSDESAAATSTPSTSDATTAAPSVPATPSPSPSASGPANVYAGTGIGDLAPAARTARSMVYVPNSQANTVQLIDPATFKVVRTFRVGREPQHVVPAWDLSRLWVNSDKGNSLVPINPRTGRHGRPVAVADPYNLYFTPDGKHALVMAERLHRIDVRDPRTMRLQRSLPVKCSGINHADYTADLRHLVVSCEFSGELLVIDRGVTKVEKVINLNAWKTPGGDTPMEARMSSGPKSQLRPGASAMPQDVRLTPDGRWFLAADMLRNGVWVIDASSFTIHRFIHTGKGAHGIYPSRDAARLFVSNRDEGTVSVLDAATLKPVARWRIPGGGSPDMGGVTADGTQLWLSGRYDSRVYVIDTATGRLLKSIRVQAGPHGMCVWPQPGSYSLGHTGNMR
jgi:YVTN family beta-propeller protein